MDWTQGLARHTLPLSYTPALNYLPFIIGVHLEIKGFHYQKVCKPLLNVLTTWFTQLQTRKSSHCYSILHCTLILYSVRTRLTWRCVTVWEPCELNLGVWIIDRGIPRGTSVVERCAFKAIFHCTLDMWTLICPNTIAPPCEYLHITFLNFPLHSPCALWFE